MQNSKTSEINVKISKKVKVTIVEYQKDVSLKELYTSFLMQFK